MSNRQKGSGRVAFDYSYGSSELFEVQEALR